MSTINRNIRLAVASALASVHMVPDFLRQSLSNLPHDDIFSRRRKFAKRVRRSTSKYMPHQGKQECARRLRVGSAAWRSDQNARKRGHYQL